MTEGGKPAADAVDVNPADLTDDQLREVLETPALALRRDRLQGVYPVEPTLRGLVLIEALARGGATDLAIAKGLGCTAKTFSALRRRDERVEEAMQRGRGMLEHELTTILLKRARDVKDPGSLTAAIFLCKARLGWREGELPPGAQVVQAENVLINMPARLTDDQFAALLARGTETEDRQR